MQDLLEAMLGGHQPPSTSSMLSHCSQPINSHYLCPYFRISRFIIFLATLKKNKKKQPTLTITTVYVCLVTAVLCLLAMLARCMHVVCGNMLSCMELCHLSWWDGYPLWCACTADEHGMPSWGAVCSHH